MPPPALAGLDLAHYRLLPPLQHEERGVYRRWSAFLPGGADEGEQLRNRDLEDLRRRALETGQGMTGWDTCRGAVSDEFVQALREALEEFVPSRATWTLARWRGYRHELADATSVTLRAWTARSRSWTSMAQ